MTTTRRHFLLSAGTMAVLGGCGGDGASTPTPAPSPGPAPAPTPTPSPTPSPPRLGNRRVGLFALQPQDRNLGNVLDRLQAVGARATGFSVQWDEIERSPGVYAPNPNIAAGVNQAFGPRGVPISLGVSVIDTNNLRMPADLAGRSFDDPVVIMRFNAMMSWLKTQIPALTVLSVSIGNEVDVYLNANRSQWPAYRTFFSQTLAHARTLYPGVPIGAKATFRGLTTSPTREEMIALNGLADTVLVTYYPLNPDFTVRPSSDVAGDFAQLAALSGGKQIKLLEAGLPTAAACQSSEALQAAFVTALFAAWDTQAARIDQIDYFGLTDFDPALTSTLLTYYGISDPKFAGYLGSLGLRTWSGAGIDKAGYARFADEIARRT